MGRRQEEGRTLVVLAYGQISGGSIAATYGFAACFVSGLLHVDVLQLFLFFFVALHVFGLKFVHKNILRPGFHSLLCSLSLAVQSRWCRKATAESEARPPCILYGSADCARFCYR